MSGPALWLQLAGLGLGVYTAFTRNNKGIYVSTFLFNFVNLCLYLFLGDYGAAVSGFLVTARSLLYVYKDRLPGWAWATPYVFCAAHIALGIGFFGDAWHVLTILAPCSVCLCMWHYSGKLQKLRIGNIINAGLWMLYNMHMGLWIVAGCRALTVLVNMASLYKNRKTAQAADACAAGGEAS